MPAVKKEAPAGSSHGLPRYATDPLDEHIRLQERRLAPGVQRDLQIIASAREALEGRLAAVDERVFNLESIFLRQCVELGGSLFDGFGLERRALQHRSMPRGGSASSGSCAASAYPAAGSPTAAVAAVASPLSAVPATPLAMAVASATSQEQSGMAFHARLHAFAPSERVFSSSSTGALGRVERARALGLQAGGRCHPSSRPRRAREEGVKDRYADLTESRRSSRRQRPEA